MNTIVYMLTAVLLSGTQVGYLQLARRFGIIDIPNDRSSHTGLTTIRGGGVLFFAAELGAFCYSGFAYPYFFAGLTLVAAVSFLDDLYPLRSRYRLGAQFAGIVLLLYQTDMLTQEVWVSGCLLVVGVGILNAYNFMDGINGMTGLYSLVCVGTLWFWQLQSPTTGFILPFAFIALLIFSYANARRRAVCFAGDVGSVSIAFIILLPMLQIIIRTGTYLPVLLLAVYGIDSVLTIVHRLCLRQNIFQAHRLHLFQMLVRERSWSHLRVSALYALLQLTINGVVIQAISWPCWSQWLLAVGITGTLAWVYIIVKQTCPGGRQNVAPPGHVC